MIVRWAVRWAWKRLFKSRDLHLLRQFISLHCVSVPEPRVTQRTPGTSFMPWFMWISIPWKIPAALFCPPKSLWSAVSSTYLATWYTNWGKQKLYLFSFNAWFSWDTMFSWQSLENSELKRERAIRTFPIVIAFISMNLCQNRILTYKLYGNVLVLVHWRELNINENMWLLFQVR